MQALAFSPGHLPTLAESQVQTHEARTANHVALTALPGEVVTESADTGRSRGVRKQIHGAVRILKHAGIRRTCANGLAAELPIRRPSGPVEKIDRESAGPASKARQLPPSKDSLREAVGVLADELSLAKRKLYDPVGIDLVWRVEVRWTVQCFRLPGIDDLTPEPAPGANALGVGSKVHGLRECVVEVKLHAMAHSMAHVDLQSVIVRNTDRAPRIE